MPDDVLVGASPAGTAARVRAAIGRIDSLDRVLVAVGVLLTLGSALAIGLPGHGLHLAADEFDIPVDTFATVVTACVAVLAHTRFRERGEIDGLLQASAFLVAMAANGYSLVLVVMADENAGLAPVGPTGQLPIYFTTAARLMTAALLCGVGLRRVTTFGAAHRRLTLAVPTLVLVASYPVLGGLVSALPHLTEDFVAAPGATPPGSTLGGTVVQLGVGVLFLLAGMVARARWRTAGSMGDRFMSIALLFAAFAQVHVAFYPGTFPGLVTSGDVLRILFDLTLLMGIEAEATVVLRRLRVANARLEELKRAEADRSALEERARLSRELHDGLAQDLWLAKLKVGRLAAEPELGPAATALCDDLKSAIDAGLIEAQQAIMALRMTSSDTDAPLVHLLRNHATDYADRFGIRVEIDVDPDLPRIALRAEAELLRIAQEALTNARRHADATVIWVGLRREGADLVLTIRDNGRGFESEAVGEGFGIAGMRERARLISGRLDVSSRPSEGTQVTCVVPLAQPALARRSA